MPLYRAYGLQLRTDQPLPMLCACPSTSHWDVDIHFSKAPTVDWSNERLIYERSYDDSDRHTELQIWLADNEGVFRLWYADGTQFFVNSAGSAVWATWPPELTLDNALTYLLGPILGFILRLRGVTTLHASAIAVNEYALAFIGAAGAGKSTTAAAFARRGFPVFSDDVVPLTVYQEHILVQPGYPHIRLWPESVDMLYGTPKALPPLIPTWDKQYLDLTTQAYQFQDQPLPLAAIYILETRIEGLTVPITEALTPREALVLLTGHTYANKLLDKTLRAHEFDLLNRLVQRVPVRRLTPPANPSYLTALCDGILADFRSLLHETSASTHNKEA